MISRGYFIGEIVDGLSDIANQVAMRGKLGLTDLNRYLEDFLKTALDHLYDLSLENLNEERSNFPGLDLADKSKGWAFQVTAENTSKKINGTLTKLTDKQISDFPKIKVLIIGKKQTSYTLDEAQCERTGFSKDDIWDMDTLCKRCMDLPLNVLQTLYDHVRSELTRVKIELEIPDRDGKFPTNMTDFIESVPKPHLTDCKNFYKFLDDQGIAEAPIEDTQQDFALLSECLAQLPRITREFLAVMIERREKERRSGISRDSMEINADRLSRISNYHDTEGELRLLMAYDFIDYDEPDYQGKSGFWKIFCSKTSDCFLDLVVDYAEENNIPLTRPIVNLDFSDF